MRKLKVIQLLPELNSGGVERGTIEVGKYLFDQGHESIVVSNGGRMVEQLIREGSKHVKIPVHRKNPISLLLLPKLRKLFGQHRAGIDRGKGWKQRQKRKVSFSMILRINDVHVATIEPCLLA